MRKLRIVGRACEAIASAVIAEHLTNDELINGSSQSKKCI